VLVTEATGFIGSRLVEQLSEMNNKDPSNHISITSLVRQQKILQQYPPTANDTARKGDSDGPHSNSRITIGDLTDRTSLKFGGD